MSDARSYWISVATRLAEPVLVNLAARRLHATMPVETAAHPMPERPKHALLEAIARLLAGLAPWLELEDRGHYRQLARECIDAATDPSSPDFMNFAHGRQPLVDTAFLAQALLRAPRQLWEPLDARVKGNQPEMADSYISTGSLYLCATGLLPLGLPANDPFWSAPAADWTAKKAWAGIDVGADHAL